MDSRAAARRWAATWAAAWQAHDVEAVVALYAQECVHRSTPFRPPHRGRQAVRDYVAQAFADEQRIDEVRFGAPVVQGDRACVEYRASFLDQQGTAMTLAGCAIRPERQGRHRQHAVDDPQASWSRPCLPAWSLGAAGG